MSDKLRSIFKDILLVSTVFALLTGSYYGFAVAERYRALTHAYIMQSEQLIEILQQNRRIPNVDGKAKSN